MLLLLVPQWSGSGKHSKLRGKGQQVARGETFKHLDVQLIVISAVCYCICGYLTT